MGRRVTIYDIARELGISTATVNRAMNNKPGVSEATRLRVLKAADAMGFTVNHLAKSLARPPIRLGFLIYNHIPVYHSEIIAGVKRETEGLKDFNVSCDIHVLSGDSYAAQQAYLQCLQQQLEERPDGFLMLPLSQSNELYSYVRQMTDAGIKVGLVGSDLPGSPRLFCCHQNAALSGKMAAELLSYMIPNGKVAVFTGHKDVQDHLDSVRGFQSECVRRSLQLVAVCENYDDPEFATYNTEKLLHRHPEIQGIYINTANSVSVCRQIKQMGYAGKIQIIASDVFHGLVDLMNEDVIQATIFQDPFRQGRNSVKYLYRSIFEEKAPPSDILIRPQIVLQSNLSEFIHYENTADSNAAAAEGGTI